MNHQVTIADSGIGFPCADDETVLDAAERAGYALPYSCRKGVCSSCVGHLGAGRAHVRGHGPAEGPTDGIPLCQTRPRTDLEITPRRITRKGAVTRTIHTVRVHRISWPADDVAALQLRLPAGRRARFTAGQYLKVLLPDGDTRSYSLANPPHRNDSVLLHIRVVPDGRFSARTVTGLKKGDELTVELPHGEFGLDTESEAPAILLATGTGFAPMRSIIEECVKRGGGRPLHLYWGARRAEDLYELKTAEAWGARLPWFNFTPVLSRPGPGWQGRTGHVQDTALADHPNLSAHEVYACGSDTMTRASLDTLTSRGGLDPARFFCDAFVASGDEFRFTTGV